MKNNFLYIILVNYKNFQDTIECLESILKNNISNVQIFIIDNSEVDLPINQLIKWAKGDCLEINTKYKSIIYPLEKKPLDYCLIKEDEFLNNQIINKLVFVKAKKNDGFSAANNIALNYILKFGNEDSIVWLLNNDTIIRPDVISQIYLKIDHLVIDKNNAIFGTPLIDYDKSELIQAIGGLYNSYTGNSKIVGANSDIKDYEKNLNKPVDFPIGASMIITKKYLSKLGLLCEDYFLYFEELDWCFRAKETKGTVKILDVLGVYHKQGSTTKAKYKKRNTEFIDLTFLKSKIKFAKKFNKNRLLTIYLYALIFNMGKRIFHGNFHIVPKFFYVIFKKKWN